MHELHVGAEDVALNVQVSIGANRDFGDDDFSHFDVPEK